MLPSVTVAQSGPQPGHNSGDRPRMGRTARVGLLGVLALSLGLGAAAPAQALGKNERNFLQGVAAAMIVDRILDDVRQQQPRRQRQGHVPPHAYAPPPPPPHAQPQHRPRPHHAQPPVYRNSIYNTPAAQAFNAYRPADRRRIQRQLASWGYYRGGIDGAFGPGTYNAVVAYANDSGKARSLRSTAGTFGLLDSLLY